MKKKSKNFISLDDRLECFGDFNIEDKVCKKFCSINIRCATTKEQNQQMEIVEEMLFAESVPIISQ